MLSGYVFCDAGTKKVLCYTKDRTGSNLLKWAAVIPSIGLSPGRTIEMKNIQERFKKSDLIDGLSIVNVGSLYKKFF